MIRRRKLFSTADIKRRKLFSSPNCNCTIKTVMCRDCGYKIETSSGTTDIVCPKCGGTRFNVLTAPFSPIGTVEPVRVEDPDKSSYLKEKGYSRRSVFGTEEDFQKEFSATTTTERNLKAYSGQFISDEEALKIFSCPASDLVDKGYAVSAEGGVNICDTAHLHDKLFSKIMISVTRTLELDPTITSNAAQSKLPFIESLTDHSVPLKSIMVIKKAHGNSMFDSSDEGSNVYLDAESFSEDSGIVSDLKLEFGGSEMGVKEFVDILDERYPDAPKDLVDYLISKGVVTIYGNQVKIIK